MADLEIDYSGIATPAQQTAQEDWEPPVHKYFGKKLANGKTEKEPIYSYQEFPRMMYGLRDGKIQARVVNSDAEKAALGDKWATNPSAFGYFTAPSFEQVLAMREAKEETEEVVAEAPRRGRPPNKA
jgi:hypothetical protein